MRRITIVLIGLFFAPKAALAQGIINNNIQGCYFGSGMHAAHCIPSFIASLIQFVFGLLSVFFLGSVIVAGYQIALSGVTGDKEAGKRRLTWSVIGLVVSICAFVILDMIIAVFAEYTP